MKNYETTLKNQGNQPKSMQTHETTLKNHWNQPKALKNHENTLKNHGNQPQTMKNQPNWPPLIQKTWRHWQGDPTDLLWSKNVTWQTQGPNWPSLVQKRYVTDAGPQLTSFGPKMLRDRREAPTDLLDVKMMLCWLNCLEEKRLITFRMNSLMGKGLSVC